MPITNGSQAAAGEATMLVGGTKAIFGNVTLPASSSTATIRSKETGEQWAHNVPAVWGENDILTISIRYSTEI